MNKYKVTAIIPFVIEMEANTPEHAATKALLFIESNALLILPLPDGEASTAVITEVKEIKDDER